MKKAVRYLALSLLLLSSCAPHPTPSVQLMPATPPQSTATLSLPTPAGRPTLTPSSAPTVAPTPLPENTASPTVTAAPTQSVRQLDPFIDTTDSLSFLNWSPDSSWLAYFNFTDKSLHFYNPVSQKTCAYPTPINLQKPATIMEWSGNETAIIQEGSRLVSGLPCAGPYAPASTQDREAFTRKDPSISPDGRYKAETLNRGAASGSYHGTIYDRQSGKSVFQLDYALSDCGGCGEWLGEWLNNNTLLTYTPEDRGPLLVIVGKSSDTVISDIFGMGNDKPPMHNWIVYGAAVAGTSAYHLLLADRNDPTMMRLYHSETGEIEQLTPMTAPSLSIDGHWLMDFKDSADHRQSDDWFRPVDPPGGAWSLLAKGVYGPPNWSPDNRTAVITTTQDQTAFAQYSMLDGSTLATWKNAQYELSPDYWSPDGSFLLALGRQIGNYSRNALFLIQIAPPAPVTLRDPPLSLPSGLAVEEYRLQERPGFAPNSDSLEFKPAGTTMEAVLNKHADDSENTTTMLYYADNLALLPFGYHLATDSWVYGHIPTQAALWKLYRGDTLVLSDISEAGQVYTGASGKDFVMTAQVPNRTVLVRKDSIRNYPFSFQDRVGMLGDDLLEAIDRAGSPAGAVEMRRAGKGIQTLPIAFGGSLLDFMGLWTYQDHWTIEVLSKLDLNLNNPVGDIYTDGVSLNQKLGYQDSFNFTYLNDQPFYFYKKDGKIGISFAGQAIPLDYNQVLHDGCCSAGVFNPGVSQNMVSFFAERDGAWYYVDVGVFPQ